MPCHIERKPKVTGNSLSVSLPKKWAKKKEMVGVIAFDLSDINERQQFYQFVINIR